jgi:hypothetical protein
LIVVSDCQFVRNEVSRILLTDAAVRALCVCRAKEFLPDQSKAGKVIAERLTTLVSEGKPASLVRVGDGEGNALSLTSASCSHPLKLSTFNAQFFNQNGITLSEFEAERFSTLLRDALVSADFIGFRFADEWVEPEVHLIEAAIANRAFGHALGFLYARELLQVGLANGLFSNTVITSAWIYVGLLRHLDLIMNAARSVVVIAGRPELQGEFEKRLGKRLRSFISIPVQGSRPAHETTSHYRLAFPAICEYFASEDFEGTLVLVGAGLFAKLYCKRAKDSGAVAVDLGSGLDLLAGLATRPVHKKISIEEYKWK